LHFAPGYYDDRCDGYPYYTSSCYTPGY
jgi:hypothetical protein